MNAEDTPPAATTAETSTSTPEGPRRSSRTTSAAYTPTPATPALVGATVAAVDTAAATTTTTAAAAAADTADTAGSPRPQEKALLSKLLDNPASVLWESDLGAVSAAVNWVELYCIGPYRVVWQRTVIVCRIASYRVVLYRVVSYRLRRRLARAPFPRTSPQQAVSSPATPRALPEDFSPEGGLIACNTTSAGRGGHGGWALIFFLNFPNFPLSMLDPTRRSAPSWPPRAWASSWRRGTWGAPSTRPHRAPSSCSPSPAPWRTPSRSWPSAASSARRCCATTGGGGRTRKPGAALYTRKRLSPGWMN